MANNYFNKVEKHFRESFEGTNIDEAISSMQMEYMIEVIRQAFKEYREELKKKMPKKFNSQIEYKLLTYAQGKIEGFDKAIDEVIKLLDEN